MAASPAEPVCTTGGGAVPDKLGTSPAVSVDAQDWQLGPKASVGVVFHDLITEHPVGKDDRSEPRLYGARPPLDTIMVLFGKQ